MCPRGLHFCCLTTPTQSALYFDSVCKLQVFSKAGSLQSYNNSVLLTDEKNRMLRVEESREKVGNKTSKEKKKTKSKCLKVEIQLKQNLEGVKRG